MHTIFFFNCNSSYYDAPSGNNYYLAFAFTKITIIDDNNY